MGHKAFSYAFTWVNIHFSLPSPSQNPFMSKFVIILLMSEILFGIRRLDYRVCLCVMQLYFLVKIIKQALTILLCEPWHLVLENV